MRPPLAAVLLAAVFLSGAVSSRANEDADASLGEVRSSLAALKTPDAAPEKAKAALAALSGSAAKLKPAQAPAVAALTRLKSAVAAATSAPAKDLPGKLKDVNARGDELLAALEGGSPASQVARRFYPQTDQQLAATLPKDVQARALKVMNGGFNVKASPAVLAAVGPTLVSPNVATAGGVSYLPAGAMHGTSDLGIAVPGPMPSVVKTQSGLQIFAEAFDSRSYSPYESAAVYMERFLQIKPPGLPGNVLPHVAQASAYAAESFLTHVDVPAYITDFRALNQPYAAPVSVKTFGFQTPVPTPANTKVSATFAGTTIEPQSVDGILPVSAKAKAVQIVTAGGSFSYTGLPQMSGSVSFSNLGNPMYKGEVAGLVKGLKINASYREAGGTGDMSRSRGVGFTYERVPGETWFGNASMIDRPGSLDPKQTTFLNIKAGLSVALNSVP